jgi:hypothetical protein
VRPAKPLPPVPPHSPVASPVSSPQPSQAYPHSYYPQQQQTVSLSYSLSSTSSSSSYQPAQLPYHQTQASHHAITYSPESLHLSNSAPLSYPPPSHHKQTAPTRPSRFGTDGQGHGQGQGQGHGQEQGGGQGQGHPAMLNRVPPLPGRLQGKFSTSAPSLSPRSVEKQKERERLAAQGRGGREGEGDIPALPTRIPPLPPKGIPSRDSIYYTPSSSFSTYSSSPSATYSPPSSASTSSYDPYGGAFAMNTAIQHLDLASSDSLMIGNGVGGYVGGLNSSQ